MQQGKGQFSLRKGKYFPPSGEGYVGDAVQMKQVFSLASAYLGEDPVLAAGRLRHSHAESQK